MTVTETPTDTGASELKDGRVVAIAGPVVDVEFPADALPEIDTALVMEAQLEGNTVVITAEVAQQIGDSRVRAICLKPTDGLRRGTVVRNTGRGITMPVGDGVLGHVFNVIGEPLDVRAEQLTGIEDRWEIHRPPPGFDHVRPAPRTGRVHRLVPRHEVARRVAFTTVERASLLRAALDDLTLFARRAGHADLFEQRP